MTTVHETSTSTEEFAGRVSGLINDAATAILLSIGHQTRLFDTLADLRRRRARR